MRANAKRAPEAMPFQPAMEEHHTCLRCPVCGTEECAVLQDLGTTCQTAQAALEATLAARVRRGPAKARERVWGLRR